VVDEAHEMRTRPSSMRAEGPSYQAARVSTVTWISDLSLGSAGTRWAWVRIIPITPPVRSLSIDSTWTSMSPPAPTFWVAVYFVPAAVMAEALPARRSRWE